MFFRYNLFTIIWAGVILLLILMPGGQMPGFENLFSFDKLAHLGVFMVLCYFMIVGFSKQHRFQRIQNNPIKYGMMVSVFYASILELGQALVPDRYANFYDLAFNIAGVFFGYALFMLIYKYSFV